MRILTDHPIASSSKDHTKPLGAVHDLSYGEKFYADLKDNHPHIRKILDLGTATGAFVHEGRKQGFETYGIDGSDSALKRGRGYWGEYHNEYLFHADIRQSFTLIADVKNTLPVEFDLITAWDVMEHLSADTIDLTVDNIVRHLKQGGYFMATIQFDDKNNEGYHTLCQPAEWWVDLFEKAGFKDMGKNPILAKVRGVPPANRFWFRRN